jgi:hypothetical protein
LASRNDRSRENLTSILGHIAQDASNAARRSDRYGVEEFSISPASFDEDFILADHSIQSGNYVEGVSGWRISGAGNAEFENVRVRGEIQAQSGLIGGYSIGTTALTSGSGTTTVGIDSSGQFPAFYAGDSDPLIAPFRVTNTGELTAAGANIEGTITAGAGSIGGWSISADEIYKGAGSTKVALNSATPKIYIGTGNHASADTPFYADSTGRFSLGGQVVWDPGSAAADSYGQLTVAGKIRGMFESLTAVPSNKLQASITAITVSGTSLATITASHAFATGETIVIEGLTGALAVVNGVRVVTVINSAQFTVAITGGTNGTTTGITGATATLREVTLGLHPAEGTGSYARDAGTGLRLDSYNWWMTNNQFRVGTSGTYLKWNGSRFDISGGGTKTLSMSVGAGDADNYFAIANAGTTPTYDTSTTQFIVNSAGQFSLGQGLRWDGANLSISGAIDVGGSDTSSFHVDTTGDVWAGAATKTAAPFYLRNTGKLSIGSGTYTITAASGNGTTVTYTVSGTTDVIEGDYVTVTGTSPYDVTNGVVTAVTAADGNTNIQIASTVTGTATLSSAALKTSGLFIENDGSISIGTDFGSEPFRVSSVGQVTVGTSPSLFKINTDGSVEIGIASSTTAGPRPAYEVVTGANLSDTFTRANSTTTLGSPWIVDAGGGTWGITGNAAYIVTAGSVRSVATLDATAADHYFSATVSGGSPGGVFSSQGIVVRYVDSDNYVFAAVVPSFGTWALIKRVAGVDTLIGNTGVSVTSNVSASLTAVGSAFTLRVNSVERTFMIFDSALQNGTRAGLAATTTATSTSVGTAYTYDNVLLQTVRRRSSLFVSNAGGINIGPSLSAGNFRVQENGQVDIGGDNGAYSLHIGIDGNLWAGAGPTGFDTAPLKVWSDGRIDVGGNDATSLHISSDGDVTAGAPKTSGRTSFVNVTAIASGTPTAGKVRYTTASAHFYSVGDVVTVVAATDREAPNGYAVVNAVITDIPSTTTFAIASSATGSYTANTLRVRRGSPFDVRASDGSVRASNIEVAGTISGYGIDRNLSNVLRINDSVAMGTSKLYFTTDANSYSLGTNFTLSAAEGFIARAFGTTEVIKLGPNGPAQVLAKFGDPTLTVGRLEVYGSALVTGAIDTQDQFLGRGGDTAASPSFSWTNDPDTGMFRVSANTIGFSTDSTQRVKIDSTGLEVIGVGGTGAVTATIVRNAAAGTESILECLSTNSSLGVKMKVLGNGNVQNVTGSYAAISDERLKTNISDARDYTDDLCRLRVRKYSLISDSEAKPLLGLISQELEEVFPGLVEESGGVKAVKYSILVPMLLTAVQSLVARVAELENGH